MQGLPALSANLLFDPHQICGRTAQHPYFNMSTIASPRESSSLRSPSSTRTSLEIPGRGTAPRRNRSALRDYYGLKKDAPIEGSDASHEQGQLREEIEVSELDKENFDAAAFVKDTLANKGSEGVLRVEAGLVSGA